MLNLTLKTPKSFDNQGRLVRNRQRLLSSMNKMSGQFAILIKTLGKFYMNSMERHFYVNDRLLFAGFKQPWLQAVMVLGFFELSCVNV